MIFLHHLGIEAEQRIILGYFLLPTGDRYSLDSLIYKDQWIGTLLKQGRTNFSLFLNCRIEATERATRKKMTPSESRRNGLSKSIIFFGKIRIFTKCKKSSKKGENSSFRKRISFINCGCSSRNWPTVLILVPT